MKRYAAEKLRNEMPDMNIALRLIPQAYIAQFAVNAWNNDAVVIDEIRRLQDEYGQRAELPTRETVLKEILTMGRDERGTRAERTNSYKLYAEINGWIGGGANKQTPVVSVFANKVMMVKNHGSDNNWEKSAVTQQANLVKEAKADAQRNETRH